MFGYLNVADQCARLSLNSLTQSLASRHDLCSFFLFLSVSLPLFPSVILSFSITFFIPWLSLTRAQHKVSGACIYKRTTANNPIKIVVAHLNFSFQLRHSRNHSLVTIRIEMKWFCAFALVLVIRRPLTLTSHSATGKSVFVFSLSFTQCLAVSVSRAVVLFNSDWFLKYQCYNV